MVWGVDPRLVVRPARRGELLLGRSSLVRCRNAELRRLRSGRSAFRARCSRVGSHALRALRNLLPPFYRPAARHAHPIDTSTSHVGASVACGERRRSLGGCPAAPPENTGTVLGHSADRSPAGAMVILAPGRRRYSGRLPRRATPGQPASLRRRGDAPMHLLQVLLPLLIQGSLAAPGAGGGARRHVGRRPVPVPSSGPAGQGVPGDQHHRAGRGRARDPSAADQPAHAPRS